MGGSYDYDDEVKDPHPVFDHPYFAPLADPVRNLVKFTLAPVRGIFGVYAGTWRNLRDADDYNVLGAFMESIDDQEEPTSSVTGVGAMLGGIAAAIGGGIVAGGAITSSLGLMAGIGGGIVAGFASAAVGAALGPLVVAGVVGTLAFAAGIGIGMPGGFVTGCIKALKHAFTKKELDPDAEPAAAKPKGPGLLSVGIGAVRKWFIKGHTKAPATPDAGSPVTEEPARPAHTSEGALEYLRNLDRDGMRRVYDSLRASFEPVAVAASAAEPEKADPAFTAGTFTQFRKLAT